MPPYCSLDEVLQVVVVIPGLQLERGIVAWFAESQQLCRFIGSVFTILGKVSVFMTTER